MDQSARSRSRYQVPMDCISRSRSQSRPSPAISIELDNVLSQPQCFAFPSLEHPSDSKPSDMQSPLSHSADDQLSLNPSGTASPGTSNIPISSSRLSRRPLIVHDTLPFSTLHEYPSLAHVFISSHVRRYSYPITPPDHDPTTALRAYAGHLSSLPSWGLYGPSRTAASDAPSEHRSFHRRMRKTSFDHTVSKGRILPGILGRQRINWRLPLPGSIMGTKRPADPHAESMPRTDPPSIHTSYPLSEAPEIAPRSSLTHHIPPISHHRSNSSFPSAPFFTAPGYDGFFDLHATRSLPHDYPPILTTLDGPRKVSSYREIPQSDLSTTPYSPYSSPPLTSDEGLSAATVKTSTAVAESHARFNSTGVEGGLERQDIIGLMYTSGGEATSLPQQPFTHVDPTQILPVDYGENGFSSLRPSPSSDGWSSSFASSTVASPIAWKSTASPDPPPTVNLRSSTSTPDLTPAEKGGSKSEEEETGPTIWAPSAPSAGGRNSSVLPKLSSSSTRPRSSTTSNTPLPLPLPLPGSRLSPSSRIGAGAAVSGTLAPASSPSFQSIFNAALDEYTKTTGNDLINHPLSIKIESCRSPDDVLGVLQEQTRVFREFRRGNKNPMKAFEPTVNALYSLSAVLPEAHPPASAIFSGVAILLQVRIVLHLNTSLVTLMPSNIRRSRTSTPVMMNLLTSLTTSRTSCNASRFIELLLRIIQRWLY